VSFAFPDALALKLQLGGDYKTLVVNDRPAGYWRLGDRAGYAQAVLSDACGGFWRLNGNATDSAPVPHNGTVNGTVTFAQAGPLSDGSTAALFDGATGYVNIADHATQNPGLGSYSYEAWVKRANTISASEFIVCKAAGAGVASGGGELFMNNLGGFTSRLNTTIAVQSATGFADGAWHHVVVSMDRAANSGQMYVDGVASGAAVDLSAAAAINLSGSGLDLLIGKRPTGNFFAGVLANVSIYTYALSAQQAANLYALRSSTIATVAAATVADSSGNGYTGTVARGVTLQQAALQPDANQAALFDGGLGSSVVATGAAITAIDGTARYSFEAWVRTPAAGALPSHFRVFYSFDGMAATYLALNDGAGYWRILSENWINGVQQEVSYGTSLAPAQPNTWYHVVVTYDNAALRLYVNGSLVDTNPIGAGAITIGPAGLRLGSSQALGLGWTGLIDEAAIYGYTLSAAQIAAHYLAGQWTDVTADVTDEDLVLTYGIQSSRPEDRVATTGTLTFGLRNDAANSGATLGWYSPYNAARRTGFDFRIRTQLAVAYSGTTYYWTGRLRVIDAVPDRFGDRVTHCVAVDWLDEAARANTQVALQTNTDGGSAFTALVGCVPNPPAATVAEAGSDSYVYAFDNIWQTVKVLSALADLARSELGYIYQRRDTTGAGETIVFENRHHRSLSSTLRASLSQVFDDLKVTNAADDIINRVRVRVYPRATLTNQVVAALSTSASSPATLLPGETQTIWLNYTDPVQRASQIGAKDQIALAATTDYTMNALADGSGADLTAFLSVTAVNFGSSVKLTVKNAGASAGVITKLQQRGTAIYALNPAEAESVTGTGETLATIDAPYQSDPTLAKLAADYIANLYSSALANVQAVRFRANQSPTLLAAALAGEISDLVQLQEDVTGLTTAQNFYINAVGLRFGLNGLIDCTWRLAPADTAQYWILGVAGASELGATTRLGF
jgi:hypothetical protein